LRSRNHPGEIGILSHAGIGLALSVALKTPLLFVLLLLFAGLFSAAFFQIAVLG